MSNRPKKSKVQYGTPAPGAPGAPRTGDNGPMGAKIAIGAAVVAVLVTIIVFAVQDGGGDKRNNVAFAPVTVTGTDLPAMPSDGGALPANDPAIGVTIPTISGTSFAGSDVEIKPGKPQIIAVLAHWCPHCQAEVPKIVEWQASGDLPKSVSVTAISTAADEAKGNFPPASWLEKEEWTNPVIIDSADSKGLNAMGATGFPTLVAVTADGKVALRGSGELTLDQVQALANAALGKGGDVPTESPSDTAPITSPVPTTAAP